MQGERFRYRQYALLTAFQRQRLPEEVRDVTSQRVSDEQQIRELRVALGVLVALDRSAFHAGEVRQLLL